MVDAICTIPLSGRFSAEPRAGSAESYPLAEFLAGPENRLVEVALRPYLANEPTPWNPLLLYGPRGSGKSHLAQGLAASWHKRFGPQSVACLPASQFAQDYAAAVAQRRLQPWRRELRAVDLFVLEDIGHLADKRGAQQELVHLVDVLTERGARVVITGLLLPSHWPILLTSLRSRLSAGLAVGLVWPARATRRAILERVAADPPLPKRVVHRLADGLNASVPVLVSALLELESKAKVDGRAVDGNRVLHFVAQRDQHRMPTLHDIAARSARYFGLTVAELKSPGRRQPVVMARGVAMYLARQLTGATFEQIGDYFGRRDHTTAIHGCQRTEKLLRHDRATRQAVADLKRSLTVG